MCVSGKNKLLIKIPQCDGQYWHMPVNAALWMQRQISVSLKPEKVPGWSVRDKQRNPTKKKKKTAVATTKKHNL